jgi:hypothetical protein
VVAELQRARRIYDRHEPRAYAYRAARCLLEHDAGTEDEAVRLLLRIWNQRVGFDRQRLNAVPRATARARARLAERSLESLADRDLRSIERIFAQFAGVLGPVGAAKALGLLHPSAFMMWDTGIAGAYCGSTWRRDAAASYGRFMMISAEQVRGCRGGREEFGDELLKRLDERNYAALSQHWM